MAIRYSIEMLVHYQCETCLAGGRKLSWFSISHGPTQTYITCPNCGTRDALVELEKQ